MTIQLSLKKVNHLLQRRKYTQLFQLLSTVVYPQGLNAFARSSGVNKTLLVRLFSGTNLPRLDQLQSLLDALGLEIVVSKKKRKKNPR